MRKLDLFTRVELSPLKIKTKNLNFNIAYLNIINKIAIPKGYNSGVVIRKDVRVGKLKKIQSKYLIVYKFRKLNLRKAEWNHEHTINNININ